MMTLLHKEILLVAHPTSIVFALLGCLVLVPAYPYSVIFMFGCLAAYITFLNARETNDVWYTAVLPVTKRAGKRSGKMPASRFLSAVSTAFLHPLRNFTKRPEDSK